MSQVAGKHIDSRPVIGVVLTLSGSLLGWWLIVGGIARLIQLFR